MMKKRKAFCRLWKRIDLPVSLAVVLLLFSILGFCFYGQGIAGKNELNIYEDRITLWGSENQEYTFQEADEMRRRNAENETSYSYALWCSLENCELKNENLKRSTQTEVYVAEGNSQLILASDVFLDGSLQQVCLIGTAAAQELFGVSDAAGLSLTFDGNTYTVIGMLTDVENGAVFQARDLREVKLNRMNLQRTGEESLASLESSIEADLGFSGRAADYKSLCDIADMMGSGVFFLLWLWLLHLILAELKRYRCLALGSSGKETAAADGYISYRETPAQKEQVIRVVQSSTLSLKGMLFRLACLGGAFVLLAVFWKCYVKIPEEMIPAKWSDFAFWGRLITEKTERMSLWIRCEKSASEMLYLADFVRTVVYLGAAYLCYFLIRAVLFGRKMMQKERKNIT